ncbi:SanA/YdcF family protein [Jiangella rhizosphaerae]|uniref:DUF218 domain-containing protein n=1 Tax=Jiangella rhizosphaerae TaxID=2293569 RepID=A0A418KJ86_9ACTN|nr:ElyC/SanA/YdcF family protein [Jiangella rhizosphaerae]RIQ13727.1 hypothetical protein DY240_25335 [Jiangella rhizosphaerae]
MSRRRWVALAAAAAVLALAVPTLWAYGASKGRILSDPADAPSTDVTMVMGAGVRADGRPSRLLAGRLDVAAALYHLGRTRTLLVSGGTAPGGYDEPAAMRRYLEDAGVPGTAIIEDPLGVDSWASCVRARDEFGLSRLLVVSQRFHLPRTVALCRSLGLDAVGVAHDSMDSNPPGTRQGYLREVAASVPAMVRAIFG